MNATRRPAPLLAAALFGALALAGCTAPDVTNTQRNRDDYARLADQAQRSTRPDGSLRSEYIADKIINGRGRSTATPVFDQPRGH